MRGDKLLFTLCSLCFLFGFVILASINYLTLDVDWAYGNLSRDAVSRSFCNGKAIKKSYVQKVPGILNKTIMYSCER